MMWISFWAGGVINGCGHFGGDRNFATPDASTNPFRLGILIGGEALHNNHHAYVTSARLSNRRFELDIGWLYIRLLAALRLATVRRVATKPRLLANKVVIDDATLQEAVIRNRHAVIAAYARMLEPACRAGAAPHPGHEPGRQARVRARHETLAAPGLGPSAQARSARADEPQCEPANTRVRVDMYEALLELWTWLHASYEQLLVQLQDWCRCTEQSDIKAIAYFSMRLRRYA